MNRNHIYIGWLVIEVSALGRICEIRIVLDPDVKSNQITKIVCCQCIYFES